MGKKLFFIILESDTKERTVCDVIEKCYTLGKRMVFFINNPESAGKFDDKLWIWKQSSFIPHIYTASLNQTFDEPVVITSEIIDSADYKLLLMYDPAPPEVMEKFDVVIDFAEKYNQALLKKSRDRFREGTKKSWEIDSVLPGSFLQMLSF